MTMLDTFTVHPDRIAAIDIRDEIDHYDGPPEEIETVIARVAGEANAIEAVNFPAYGCIGIAWGGYATWTTQYLSITDALTDYLDHPQTFAAYAQE
ncbi:MAG: hypothetical protein WBA46_01805 [Thermomicrobiales bacterium]